MLATLCIFSYVHYCSIILKSSPVTASAFKTTRQSYMLKSSDGTTTKRFMAIAWFTERQPEASQISGARGVE